MDIRGSHFLWKIIVMHVHDIHWCLLLSMDIHRFQLISITNFSDVCNVFRCASFFSSIALLSIALFYIALLCYACFCFALLCFAFLCIALLFFAFHRSALHCFALFYLCFALLSKTLQCFALHGLALLCIALLLSSKCFYDCSKKKNS